MKKTLIFDLDGTLWDTTKAVRKIWNKVLNEENLKFSKADIKNIMGLTTEEIINFLFKNNYKKGNEFIIKCQNEENVYLSHNGGNIYRNVLSTIKKLINGNDLYIVSNCQSGYIEAFFKYYELRDYFIDYECYGNTGKEKATNIRILLERNNINNAIYVGDTEKDYLAAKENNLKFIWAKYGFGECKKYDDYIEDISELNYKII